MNQIVQKLSNADKLVDAGKKIIIGTNRGFENSGLMLM